MPAADVVTRMTYRESIDWLFSTQLFGIKLGLDGPRRLLKEFLAHPAHGVKVLHVAGTNGKGSTCALADSVARASGVRCGLFTSPHLVDFRERIRVMGAEIPEEDCAALIREVRGVCERLDPHPTFFEITLAVAMRWFRERECELIVLETGMGGRLDATTAVPADVCGISAIGMDHAQWLGDTLEAIAREKAGIMVEGKPVVSVPQASGVARVLEMEANERRSPLSWVAGPMQGYPLGLFGEHQKWNAALALDCLHLLGVRLDYEVVRHGLGEVRWPGRFEVVEHDGRTLVLDGAHNPQGVEALVAGWRQRFGGRKASLVFAVASTKEIAPMAAGLAEVASSVHVAPIDSPRAVPAAELAAAFAGGARVHESGVDAVTAALEDSELVLVAGSLFLVGEVKAWMADADRHRGDQ